MKYIFYNCAKFLYFPPRTPLGELTAALQASEVPPRQIPGYAYALHRPRHAMHHRLCGLSTYGLSGLRKGDEHPPMLWRGMAPFTFTVW